jgi:hypothetical protein
MMDYFRWLAFVKCRDFFDSGVFLLIIVLNALFVVVLTVAFWPLGIILLTPSIMFWLFVAFLFAQRAWNANRAEYEKFKDRTK